MSDQQESLKTAATPIPSFYLLSETEGCFTLKNDQILFVPSSYGSPAARVNVAFRKYQFSVTSRSVIVFILHTLKAGP